MPSVMTGMRRIVAPMSSPALNGDVPAPAAVAAAAPAPPPPSSTRSTALAPGSLSHFVRSTSADAVSYAAASVGSGITGVSRRLEDESVSASTLSVLVEEPPTKRHRVSLESEPEPEPEPEGPLPALATGAASPSFAVSSSSEQLESSEPNSSAGSRPHLIPLTHLLPTNPEPATAVDEPESGQHEAGTPGGSENGTQKAQGSVGGQSVRELAAEFDTETSLDWLRDASERLKSSLNNITNVWDFYQRRCTIEKIWEQIESLETLLGQRESNFARPSIEQLESELEKMENECAEGIVPRTQETDAVIDEIRNRILDLKEQQQAQSES